MLRWFAVLLLICLLLPVTTQAQTAEHLPYQISEEGIVMPLGGLKGDAQRGRAAFISRTAGHCLACHHAPIPEEDFHGTVGPNLAGVGRRLSVAQLRQRLVDARSINPDSVMPSFYRTTGRTQVEPAFEGVPLLTAQQVEDIVAYLLTVTEDE